MTENILHVKHRLKLPPKHFIDFGLLTAIGVAPWFWWVSNGGTVAFTVSIIVSIIAVGLLLAQLVGGIKIRRNTTLHFEADVSNHSVSSWMEKPPTQWRNYLSPADVIKTPFDSFDNIFAKKINSKPVLYLANKEEHAVKVLLPHRLAHVPAVNSYVKERIAESGKFNSKSLNIAEVFLNTVSESDVIEKLEI